FAAVIAGAFDDGGRARIAHAEALAGNTAEVRFARDRAIHHRVADDDVGLGDRRTCGIRVDDDAPAGKAFAHVVVGGALQLERDPTREESAEALAGYPLEGDVNRVLGKPGVPVLP